ncbi:hypothetical protein AKO1_012829 [Acrasis kona]|uniref:Uncharacterized protein n=1 Tax=Acrasis kona TaxID=1008807 RepID=A0AAW2YVX5_9EUKA
MDFAVNIESFILLSDQVGAVIFPKNVTSEIWNLNTMKYMYSVPKIYGQFSPPNDHIIVCQENYNVMFFNWKTSEVIQNTNIDVDGGVRTIGHDYFAINCMQLTNIGYLDWRIDIYKLDTLQNIVNIWEETSMICGLPINNRVVFCENYQSEPVYFDLSSANTRHKLKCMNEQNIINGMKAVRDELVLFTFYNSKMYIVDVFRDVVVKNISNYSQGRYLRYAHCVNANVLLLVFEDRKSKLICGELWCLRTDMILSALFASTENVSFSSRGNQCAVISERNVDIYKIDVVIKSEKMNLFVECLHRSLKSCHFVDVYIS